MTRHRLQLYRFGRMAVGQRVRYDRCIMPPTTLNSFWNNLDEPVSIQQNAEITAITKGEDHAFVTLRFEGGGEKTELFNWWGQAPGGFSSLAVLHEAPEQRILIRETA